MSAHTGLSPFVQGSTDRSQRRGKKQRRKKRKRKETQWQTQGRTEDRPDFPFTTKENDHCETNREAYEDIAPLMEIYAKAVGKPRSDIRIYDPYYCNGGVKRHLREVGFPNVLNDCVDFYTSPRKPDEFDVILTNPPYSEDHFSRMFRFCMSIKKPSLLLLPHYCYTKPYFKTNALQATFFICPGMGRRYHYTPPRWVSQSDGTTCIQKDKPTTSPFPTFWYCYIPDAKVRKRVIRMYEKTEQVQDERTSAVRKKRRKPNQTPGSTASKFEKFAAKTMLCRSLAELPNELRSEFDRKRKRPNPKARRKLARKKATLLQSRKA